MLLALMEPGLFDIERPGGVTRDPLGNVEDAYTVVARGLPGRLEQATSHEAGDDTIVVSKWRGFLLAGTDLRSGDRLRARGHRYEVEGAPSEEHIPGFPAIANVSVTLSYIGLVTD